MHQFISETAKWGDLISGPRVVNDKTKKEMGKILKDIQKGKFAKEWIEENKAGKPKYNKLIQQDFDHPIEKVGAELRARMPWLNDKRA
jgi:ketol-acid reductoisomerase